MRILVWITCIAVLFAVGYYFWKEYGEHQAAIAATNEVVLDRPFCLSEANRALSNIRSNKTYEAICLEKGLITEDDIDKLTRGQDVN